MDRRSFLLGSMLLASFAGMGTGMRKSWGNSHFVVDEALYGTYLQNVDDVVRISHLSYAFANIRIFYNRPFGYENTDKFKQHVFEWLNLSFYGGDSNVRQQTELVNEYLDEKLKEGFKREMGRRLESNLEGYRQFVDSIGVEPVREEHADHDLNRDFLQAQAVFSVFAGTTRYSELSRSERDEALEGDGSLLNFFDDFTGIWPFCKSPS